MMWNTFLANMVNTANIFPQGSLSPHGQLVPLVTSTSASSNTVPGLNYESLEDAHTSRFHDRQTAAEHSGSSSATTRPKVAAPGSRGPPARSVSTGQTPATAVSDSKASTLPLGKKPPVFVESQDKRPATAMKAHAVKGMSTTGKYSPGFYASKCPAGVTSSRGAEGIRESGRTSRSNKETVKTDVVRGSVRQTSARSDISVDTRRPSEPSTGPVPRRQSTKRDGHLDQPDSSQVSKKNKVVCLDDEALEQLTQRFNPPPTPRPPPPPHAEVESRFPPQAPGTN